MLLPHPMDTAIQTDKATIMKLLFTALGLLATALAVAGIFLPVLPTSPLLLLAAWLFYRSNPRLRHWLINHPVLGSYIKNYLTYRAIPLRAKVISISTLWVVISVSVFMLMGKPLIQTILLLIAVGVTIHICRIRTLRRDRIAPARQEEEFHTQL